MIILLRVLVRLIGLIGAALLAVAGAAAAVFCIDGGHGTLSLPRLASDIHLPQLRDDIATLLARLTAHGSVAAVAALAGLGAVLLGLVILAGALLPTRQGRITLETDEQGSIGAQRRALAEVADALVRQRSEIRRARSRARPRRRQIGGRLSVSAQAWNGPSQAEAAAIVRESLSDLTDSATLALRVTARVRKPDPEQTR